MQNICRATGYQVYNSTKLIPDCTVLHMIEHGFRTSVNIYESLKHSISRQDTGRFRIRGCHATYGIVHTQPWRREDLNSKISTALSTHNQSTIGEYTASRSGATVTSQSRDSEVDLVEQLRGPINRPWWLTIISSCKVEDHLHEINERLDRHRDSIASAAHAGRHPAKSVELDLNWFKVQVSLVFAHSFSNFPATFRRIVYVFFRPQFNSSFLFSSRPVHRTIIII